MFSRKVGLRSCLSIILGPFLFLVVVNLILINMMMAIINLAFEEIKENASDETKSIETSIASSELDSKGDM